jgi:hypothetical protein
MSWQQMVMSHQKKPSPQSSIGYPGRFSFIHTTPADKKMDVTPRIQFLTHSLQHPEIPAFNTHKNDN